jgi:predicted RNase H-like nuclease (RuvC/YqgF family)
MKTKEARITLLIAIVILLTGAVWGYSHFKKIEKNHVAAIEVQKSTFNDIISKRDSIINEWVLTSNQIEKDIQIIKEKEKFVSMNSNGELSKDDKQKLLEDMKYISTLIDANKQKLQMLNEQLRKSGGIIKGLQNKVATLDSSLNQNTTQIADLKSVVMKKSTEITKLDSTVKDMKVTIEQKNMTIVSQIDELNMAFLTVGTSKELLDKGLITKSGGFIGLGKTKSMNTNTKNDLFTQVDISTIKSIPVDAKSVKFITDHPNGSYTVVYSAEIQKGNKPKVSHIDITNSKEFWKISKYAIVEIKK